MTGQKKRFIIVDDDPQNNLVSRLILKKAWSNVEVIDFLSPEKGLEYIESQFTFTSGDKKTILFLDINMPVITGWEFLEKFVTFKTSLQKQFSIYILSSSVDQSDIQRAKSNPLIIGFIEKPLNKAALIEMFG